MNKLQEKLLALKGLREATAALFAKYDDVGQMSADELATVKSNNAQIEALETECKTLEDVEAMKAANTKGLEAFKHHAGDSSKAENNKSAVQVYSRVTSLKSFKGEVGGKSADERAYRFAKWFTASVVGMESARKWCNDNNIEIKAHSEGTNSAGGYLVPNEFSNDLIDLRESYGVARRVAKVVSMASDTLLVPRRRTGLTAYWVGEATAITESSKSWDMVQLVARKMGALALYSSELNEDAMVNIGDDLAGEIAYAFAYTEDNCYFNGDGTSTYGGIQGVRPKLLAVDSTIANIKGLYVGTGNLYSELALVDFHAVLGKLPLYARSGAVWIASATFHDTVMQKLQTAAGGNVVADIANGGVMRFLGYPVVLSQVMPTTEANSQICALLGNFNLATTFGDRRQLTLSYSSDYKFAEDQLAIKGTQRIDINVHDVGDTTNPGPIVGLITAAS